MDAKCSTKSGDSCNAALDLRHYFFFRFAKAGFVEHLSDFIGGKNNSVKWLGIIMGVDLIDIVIKDIVAIVFA